MKKRYFIFLIMITMILVSCSSNSTSNANGSVSGTVLVQDNNAKLVASDNVVAALYHAEIVDSSLFRIQTRNYSLGFSLTDNTEFDHRLMSPVMTTVTDNLGTYKFTNVPTGKYILVIYKQNYDIKYIFDVQVNEANTVVTTVTLNPIISLSGVFADNYTFLSNRQYLITDNVIMAGHVVIQEGAHIYFNTQKKIELYSGCDAIGTTANPILICSSDSLYSTVKQAVLDQYVGIINYQTNSTTSFQHCLISNMIDGIQNQSPDLHIEFCRFNNNNTVLFSSGANVTLKNCIISKTAAKGILITNSGLVTKNIFANNKENLVMQSSNDIISNNYFYKNFNALRPFYGTPIIKNNCFENNNFAISARATNATIEYNNFLGSLRYDIQTQLDYVQQSYVYSNIDVHYNNFYTTSSPAISLVPDRNDEDSMGDMIGVHSNQYCENNYWKKYQSIADLIIDKYDENQSTFICYYEAFFTPYSTYPIAEAGISSN